MFGIRPSLQSYGKLSFVAFVVIGFSAASFPIPQAAHFSIVPSWGLGFEFLATSFSRSGQALCAASSGNSCIPLRSLFPENGCVGCAVRSGQGKVAGARHHAR
jgi:hypothetical protein